MFAMSSPVASNGDREGISTGLAGAMVLALSVVATNISGIPEVGEQGWTVCSCASKP